MTHPLKLTVNKIEWLNQSSRKIVQNPQAKTTGKQPIFSIITQFSGQKLNNLSYFLFILWANLVVVVVCAATDQIHPNLSINTQ